MGLPGLPEIYPELIAKSIPHLAGSRGLIGKAKAYMRRRFWVPRPCEQWRVLGCFSLPKDESKNYAKAPVTRNRIAYNKDRNETRDDQAHHVESALPRRPLRRRQKLGPGFSPVRLGRRTRASFARTTELCRRPSLRPCHLRRNGRLLANRHWRSRQTHERRAENRRLTNPRSRRLAQHKTDQR